MNKYVLVLVYFSQCIGMDLVERTRVVSPFSHKKRDELYQRERDKLLCAYKCLYPDELFSCYSPQQRDDLVCTIKSDLEKKVSALKEELNAQLQMEGAALVSTAANGIVLYRSDHIMPLVGFLGSLMWSAIYAESTLLSTRASLRFNSHYLKKFKTVEMLKKLEIVISDNYEEK